MAQQRESAAQRAAAAAQVRVERARAAAARAAAAAERASEAERKRLAKEALAAHVEAMQAEVERLNAGLAGEYAQIDGILAATLESDDWVDLQSLKRSVQHPPFPHPELERPNPAPGPIEVPPAPIRREPQPPSGLFGRKKKLETAKQQAQAEYQQAMQDWMAYRDSIPAQEAALKATHAAFEQKRLKQLKAETSRYEADCRERENEVAEHNASIDDLEAGLGYGAADAVEEYVGIVLANSLYPDHFPVQHEAQFDPATAELMLTVAVPAPNRVRTVKAYRYVKASDEITEAQLSKTEAGNRYASALHQVAIRSLHEIFESDRQGIIQAISLQVGPQTKDPATGRSTFIPLVAVTSPRETFLEFDLSGVVPSATLQHLGAAVSKSPATLVAVDPAGVRRS
ncbi:hypothetical protein RBS60_13590 [Sinomonas sp. ASV486]|uniref:hypothetical protein n=1 Tax=Sinomonas sp. ASV486 TaxID=3051170 RepID=UPI0027DB2F1D|nr:hypothetical protein [Sinomonas sp. ASV486]MDQ4491230.1 hypothetical protein [Sinomonas sp. ASV486]